MPLLADLLQDLTGGLPGDPLQSEQTNGEPLAQQALQSATEVLKIKKKEIKVLNCIHKSSRFIIFLPSAIGLFGNERPCSHIS